MKRAAKVLIRDDQGKILVLYRSETHPSLAHDIDLPGGIIEDDESTEGGLVREIQEETGIAIGANQLAKLYSWQTDSGEKQTIYQANITTRTVQISWEHKSYAWVDGQELIQHKAIDGFMHRVQAWLSSGTTSV